MLQTMELAGSGASDIFGANASEILGHSVSILAVITNVHQLAETRALGPPNQGWVAKGLNMSLPYRCFIAFVSGNGLRRIKST